VTLVFPIVGAITCLLVSAALLILVFGYAVDAVKNLYVHLCYKAEELERRKMGVRLMQESWWYSEDASVKAALEIIGRKYSEGGFANISDARSEWRERMGKPK
jgi:hypothetical protein